MTKLPLLVVLACTPGATVFAESAPWSWDIGIITTVLPKVEAAPAGDPEVDTAVGFAAGLEVRALRTVGQGTASLGLAVLELGAGDAENAIAYAGDATRLRGAWSWPLGTRVQVGVAALALLGTGYPQRQIAGSEDQRVGERGNVFGYGAEATIGCRLGVNWMLEAQAGYVDWEGKGRLNDEAVSLGGKGLSAGLSVHYRFAGTP